MWSAFCWQIPAPLLTSLLAFPLFSLNFFVLVALFLYHFVLPCTDSYMLNVGLFPFLSFPVFISPVDFIGYAACYFHVSSFFVIFCCWCFALPFSFPFSCLSFSASFFVSSTCSLLSGGIFGLFGWSTARPPPCYRHSSMMRSLSLRSSKWVATFAARRV